MRIASTLGDPPRATHTGHTHLMQHHAHDGVTSCYAIPTRLNAHLTHAHTTHDKPYARALHAPHAHDSATSGTHPGAGEGTPAKKDLAAGGSGSDTECVLGLFGIGVTPCRKRCNSRRVAWLFTFAAELFIVRLETCPGGAGCFQFHSLVWERPESCRPGLYYPAQYEKPPREQSRGGHTTSALASTRRHAAGSTTLPSRSG